jgi:hypothetical protein
MAKKLGALAALAALGYMASRGSDKGETPSATTGSSFFEDDLGSAGDSSPEPMPEPKAIPKKPMAPVTPSTKSVASAGGRDGAGQMADYKMRKARDLEAGMSRGTRPATAPASKAPMSNYSNEGRGREMTKRQQAEYGIDSLRPSAEQTQKGLETATSIMGGASLKALGSAAKNLANRGTGRTLQTIDQQALPYSGAKQIANNPTRQITGPSKGDLVARDRAARSASRNEEMLRDNARRYGLDPDNINPAVADQVRKGLGGKDFSLGMRRGGQVKRMASGGMTSMSSSSASRRGDGIASKGKTRGKIC